MQNTKLQNLTILVVEDEDRNWYLLRELIEMWEGNAIWAESGMQAIEIVKNNPSVDIVLMDLNLPFMSGIETTKRIKSIREDLPVIAQTAYAEHNLLNNCMNAGCSSYILKPIEIPFLKKVLLREASAIMKAPQQLD
ncbi:MAG: response regulator [Bacteroidales bacterium]|nr:response regulator [Bacteroidales bacterium]MBN2820808.1 response regulator [Bacteroidales bacterium]